MSAIKRTLTPLALAFLLLANIRAEPMPTEPFVLFEENPDPLDLAAEPFFGAVIGTNETTAEREIQFLKDFRRLVQTSRLEKGDRYVTRFIRRSVSTYRKVGYGKIAKSLEYSLPTLLEAPSPDPRPELNRPRARRSIRRVLRASLAFQPLVSPSARDTDVPFYTLIAVNYGTQLRAAYQNALKSRRLTKGFGKNLRDMWIRSHGAGFVNTGLVPTGLNYTVTPDHSSGFSASITGAVTFRDTGTFIPSLTAILGTFVALPADEVSPTGSYQLAINADTVTLNGIRYGLSTVPTDPPHKLYVIPEGTEIPDTAYLIPKA